MRRLSFALLVVAFSGAALAADLKIKVVDPQGAAVAGAQVELYAIDSKKVLAVQITSAAGAASLHVDHPGALRVRVLAPGFAESTVNVPTEIPETLIVKLRLATASETVIVSATRYPQASEASGTAADVLSGAQLQTMQPVASDDAMRFLPGSIISTAGQRGGLASLFVRGGESRYNKVIVDGVPVNDPGGTFDFGTLPLFESDRLEFVRGAQSTLYGSDAMSSVVQVWTRTGSTAQPELRFGADAGNFGTENGYASLSGAHGRFDYNVFGNQINTMGLERNDDYSNSLVGVNTGVRLNDWASLRLRARHDHSVTGVQNEWDFNGIALLPPDRDQRAQLDNLLGSLELTINSPSGWQHTLTGFEHTVHRRNIDTVDDQFNNALGLNPDLFPFDSLSSINRAGFQYQGSYAERTWAQATFGYQFEDENGFVGDLPTQTHGRRLDDETFAQQQLVLGRLTAIVGGRFVHNSKYGDTGLPEARLSYLAFRGRQTLSGTRLFFSYGKGFKEPRLEETFAGPPTAVPNPGLKPERSRSFEAGLQQGLLAGKFDFRADYFNSLFHNEIAFPLLNLMTFVGQYQNINRALAHGAEAQIQSRIRRDLLLNTSYTYTSTQILQAPACTPEQFCDVTTFGPGKPLLHRPKHSATILLTYAGRRWGGNLGGSFVGRRADTDFYGLGFNHAPGYVRADLAGWYAVTRRVTMYANVENALDRRYNEVVGYPALPVNFRAGMRFRIGGE